MCTAKESQKVSRAGPSNLIHTGGSAGSIGAVQTMIGGLPADEQEEEEDET